MEVAAVGVRSRARAMAAEEAEEDSGPVKRSKIAGNEELRWPSSTLVQTQTCDRENFVNHAEEDGGELCAADVCLRTGDVPASCCSSNGSTEQLKLADLEVESVEIETVSRHNSERRESTPTSEFTVDSFELESTNPSTVIIDSHRTLPVEQIPSASELEEFFAAPEKDLQKRFIDKYNYDIENDVPLKGRYEWVQLNQ